MIMEQKPDARTPKYHLSIWASLFIIYGLLFAYQSTNLGFTLISIIIFTLVTASSIFRIWYRLIPRYLDKRQETRFVLVIISWLFFDALIILLLIMMALGLWPDIDAKDLSGGMNNMALSIGLMWVLEIAWVFIIIGQKQRVKELDAAKLQVQLAESEAQRKQLELEQLKNQLQPHFLFNTLNTLYGAALQKADHTPEMIMELSSMLDFGLYHASKAQVPLQDDLSHIKRYLSLEKKRFRDQINVNWTETGNQTTLALPPLLLMPLVENAVKHGKKNEGFLNIDIDLEVDESMLLFKVSNPSELAPEGEGFGLASLRKRLASLFPEKHELRIQHKDDTFTASLRLFFR